MSPSANTPIAAGFSTRSSVRVRRSGNSKVLPVPAEVGREAHVELGQDYTVEILEGGLLYRRTGGPVQFIGDGPSRVGVVPSSRVMAAPQRSGATPLDDWDF